MGQGQVMENETGAVRVQKIEAENIPVNVP
jgi:hypothetical protein